MGNEIEKQPTELSIGIPTHAEVFNETYEVKRTEITPTIGVSFANLQLFISEAARKGIHYRVKQHELQTNKKWAMQWNLLGLYAFTPATLADLGDKHGISRERVRQIVKKATFKLHEAVPDEMREAHSIQLFDFQKPVTVQTRLKSSRAKGGILERVLQLANENKSVTEIRNLIPGSRNAISSIRKNKDLYNTDIPYKLDIIKLAEDIPTLADSTTSNEVKQAVLDAISDIAFTLNHPEIIRLSKLLADAGIGFGGKIKRGESGVDFVVRILKESGIPASVIEKNSGKYRMRYGLLASVDKERALEVLKSHEELAQYKTPTVIEITETGAKIPTTYDIQQKSLVNISKIIGIKNIHKLTKSGLSIEDLIRSSSSVPVFRHERNGLLYCSLENIDKFSSDIEESINKALESIQ